MPKPRLPAGLFHILTMNRTIQLPERTLAVLALALFTFGAYPSQTDKPFAFVQGRVSTVALGLMAFLVYSFVLHRHQSMAALKRLWQQPFNKLAVLWLGLASISAAFAPNTQLSFLGSEWGQMGILQLSLCVGLFLVGQTISLDDQHWRWLSYGLALMLFLTFLECLGYRPLFWLPEVDGMPAATIGQRGHLAGFFAVCAGAAAYRRAYRSLLMAGVGIALCNNTSALVGFILLCLALLVITYKTGKNWWPIGAALLATVLLFSNISIVTQQLRGLTGQKDYLATKKFISADTTSLTGRLDIWEASVNMIKARPFIGWGDEQFEPRWLSFLPYEKSLKVAKEFMGLPQTTQLEGYGPAYSYKDIEGNPKLGIVRNIHPHNAFLEEIQNHGIVGASISLLCILLIFRSYPAVFVYSPAYLVYLSAWFYLFSVFPIFVFIMGIVIKESSERRRHGKCRLHTY